VHLPTSLQFAQTLDENDVLREHRERFYIPQIAGRAALYFTGNSLGLQPKTTRAYIERELKHWELYGVEGHFEGEMPWKNYHHFLLEQSAALVGAADKNEVVVMNTLTTNLHLMMVSFYQPTATRYKIVMEAGAFPSDQYAVESQTRFHGFDPNDAIIEIRPREGEHTLRTEDIVKTIKAQGDTIALVLFSGVNYYTGQFFDLETIAKTAHSVGAYCGFDLAHAVGNVPLELHRWQADFAVWCSYKYLNAGPGGPGGIFVHQKHANNPALPRFAGWWGHDEASRFQMKKGFIPMQGAAGWQQSNAQIFSFAAAKASLDIFHEVGVEALRQKSEKMTGYLEFLLNDLNTEYNWFNIITPSNPEERGCQLSLVFHKNGRTAFEALTAAGVISDWREPNVIRIAPVPLYNSFEDVWRFVEVLRNMSL
jgi:kynureninase